MPESEVAVQRYVYSVSQLNSEVRAQLEGGFPLLWVEGEISNLSRPASGHLYFTLKDQAAQVRCAMFRMRCLNLGFKPENGMHVLLRVRISLYEARGEYQLIAEHMEEAGDGALQRAFEALKKRLAAEGLFEPARKRPLPGVPRCVGIVTSPSGAAIRDILTVLRRRFPAIPVIVYPVAVQGSGAAAQIAAAIDLASRRHDCDALIVGRGGGSLEDLWPFNEEVVARAIHRCAIPVVSAVGHEIDFTIADFVADQRAPTPSAAAELISPDGPAWCARISRLETRLLGSLRQQVRQRGQRIEWLSRRLVHPGTRLRQLSQRLDECEQRMVRAQAVAQRHARQRLAALLARVEQQNPCLRLHHLELKNTALSQRLHAALRNRLLQAGHRLATTARALDAVSPLATLRRGYAIVERLPDHRLVHRADDLRTGDRIEARLGEGRVHAQVYDILKE